ncbi:MAG: hypothetical protein KY469_18210 [Actinobacteria bacterium]|nr:hypothetical protein [Actinomycetota bacterium]
MNRDGAFDDHVDGELTGFKVARLGSDGLLHGVTTGSYAVIDRATCRRLTAHRAPHLHCRCGFHAYKSRRDAATLLRGVADFLLLEVGLSGRFLEFELGYRAEYQRVRRIEIDNVCGTCGAAASGVGVLGAPPSDLIAAARLLLWGNPARLRTLVPACQEHAAAWIDMAELAQLLRLSVDALVLTKPIAAPSVTLEAVLDPAVSTATLFELARSTGDLRRACRELPLTELHRTLFKACDIDPSGWRALLVRQLADGNAPTALDLPRRWWRQPVDAHQLVPAAQRDASPPPPATWPVDEPR